MLEEHPDTSTPVPQRLETSVWGSRVAVQSRVVNQNESMDLGNTNTNIALLNTTALTSLIKTRDLLSVHKHTAELCVCAHACISSKCMFNIGVGLCYCALMRRLVPFCTSWHDSQHHQAGLQQSAVRHTKTSISSPDTAVSAPPCSWRASGISITL